MAMTFLEEIQKRLAEVQTRANEVTRRLGQVQAEHQSVMQELGSYQKIAQVEALRLQREQQQSLIPGAAGAPPTVQTQPQPQSVTAPVLAESPTNDDGNKTEAIREFLRQHPAGMTPAQLWQQMKNRVAHRQYIYGVLKRLKDQKQVTERRGKYYFQPVPKSEEGVNLIVQ